MDHGTCREDRIYEFWGQGVVIIRVKPGETNEAAWKRYLQENPEDRGAMVKIFNHEFDAGVGNEARLPAREPAEGLHLKLALRTRTG